MQILSTSPLVKTYTLEEFWRLPEPKDGSKLELIAGMLYLSPPPDGSHNLSWAALNRLFIMHPAEIGDCGVALAPRAALWMSPDTYAEPDSFYLSECGLKQLDLARPERAETVVEIVSLSTAIYDCNTKADTYAALGVRELWMVDPGSETIEVCHLKRGMKGGKGRYDAGKDFQRGQRVKSQLLPRFTPSITKICRHALPRKSQ